jgi:hypothetical protein
VDSLLSAYFAKADWQSDGLAKTGTSCRQFSAKWGCYHHEAAFFVQKALRPHKTTVDACIIHNVGILGDFG